MLTDYPVQVEVRSPARFEPIQLALRIALAVVLGWVGITAGGLIWLLYGALPVIAAIAVSAIGSERYLKEVAPRVASVLTWLLQLSAYMMLLVDRFPVGGADEERRVRIEVQITGTPTIGTALLRLLTSIPSALVLAVLWLASAMVWIVGALFILFTRTVPSTIVDFQRGVFAWQARLVAYHASLVEAYPPWSLEARSGQPAQGTVSGSG